MYSMNSVFFWVCFYPGQFWLCKVCRNVSEMAFKNKKKISVLWLEVVSDATYTEGAKDFIVPDCILSTVGKLMYYYSFMVYY